MENTPKQFLTRALPSVILYLAATIPTLVEIRPYREVFGNDDTYLDLYYDTNPDGWFQPKTEASRVRFHGKLTTGQGDFAVAGERVGRAHYRFDSAVGKFQGKLRSVPKACEPAMDFRIERDAKVATAGVMRAAFCL